MTSRLLPVLVVTVLAGFARGQDFPAPGNLAPPAGGAELRDDKGTPFAPGRYLCWLENGVRRMQLKDPPASRPAPPAR